MRGDLKYKILNTIEDKIVDLVDLQIAILKSGYGASSNKMEYEFSLRRKNRERYEIRREKIQESKIRLQKYISKLKADGLLRLDGVEIRLTSNGIKQLVILRKKLLKDIPQEPSPNLVILSYDFPVRDRILRDRVREILKILDFKMIHQSLWVGKIKIPKELLKYLEEIEALKYIEILEVTKQGTLEKIT